MDNDRDESQAPAEQVTDEDGFVLHEPPATPSPAPTRGILRNKMPEPSEAARHNLPRLQTDEGDADALDTPLMRKLAALRKVREGRRPPSPPPPPEEPAVAPKPQTDEDDEWGPAQAPTPGSEAPVPSSHFPSGAGPAGGEAAGAGQPAGVAAARRDSTVGASAAQDGAPAATPTPTVGPPILKKPDEGDKTGATSSENATWKLYTKETFETQVEAERKRSIEEARMKQKFGTEGRLVNGELVFAEDVMAERVEFDPELAEGEDVPKKLGKCPEELIGVPLQEIDTYIMQLSFIIIQRRILKQQIFRVSPLRSLWFIDLFNPIRWWCVIITTHQFFEIGILLVVIANAIWLAINLNLEIDYPEFVFLAIYLIEFVMKVIARGFALQPYSYLRDGWNWLDFIIIIISLISIIIEFALSGTSVSFTGLRTFRVFRLFRTFALIPGIRGIVMALLYSFRLLLEVMFLFAFAVLLFAIFGVQVFKGFLRQKCITTPSWPYWISQNPSLVSLHDIEWTKNTSYWGTPASDQTYRLCSNGSWAGSCDWTQTCWPDVGENPDYGYINYDNVFWGMLQGLSLLTLSKWETQYHDIIRSSSPWYVIYYILVILIGGLFLVNLMLAVIVISYEEATNELKKNRRMRVTKKKRLFYFEKKGVKKGKKGNKEAKEEEKRLKEEQEAAERARAEREAYLNRPANEIAAERKQSNKKLVAALIAGRAGLDTKNVVAQQRARDEALKRQVAEQKEHRWAQRRAATEPPPEPPADEDNATPVPGKPGGVTIGKTTQIGGGKGPLAGPGAKGDAKGKATSSTSASMASLPRKTSGATPAGEGGEEDKADDDKSDAMSVSSGLDSSESGVFGGSTGSSDAGNSDEYGGTVILVENVEDEEAEPEELVDRNLSCCKKCCQPRGCFLCLLRVQNRVFTFVTDPLFELFIIVMIICNSVILCLYWDGMSDTQQAVLDQLNNAFTGIFAIEAILKIIGMSIWYFKQPWNIFDLIIVLVSIATAPISTINGLNVFRTFRLLRIMKIFDAWEAMRVVVAVVLNTLFTLVALVVVVFISVFVFAVMGLQLVGDYYKWYNFTPELTVPRYNYVDFWHSMLTAFRILVGDWFDTFVDCTRVAGLWCLVLYIPAIIFLFFMVINLFLAVILRAFASDKIKEKPEGPTKLELIVARIKGICCPDARCCDLNRAYCGCCPCLADSDSGSGSSGSSSSDEDDDYVSGSSGSRPASANASETGSQAALTTSADIAATANEQRHDKRRHKHRDTEVDSARGGSPDDAGDAYRRDSRPLSRASVDPLNDEQASGQPKENGAQKVTSNVHGKTKKGSEKRRKSMQTHENPALDRHSPRSPNASPENGNDGEGEQIEMTEVRPGGGDADGEGAAGEHNGKKKHHHKHHHKHHNENRVAPSPMPDAGASTSASNTPTNETSSSNQNQTEDSHGNEDTDDEDEEERKPKESPKAREIRELLRKQKEEEQAENAEYSTEKKEVVVPNCFCLCCYKCCCPTIGEENLWHKFRYWNLVISSHLAFDLTMIVIIIMSSVELALEDIWLYENPTEQTVLFYINLSIAILFSVELVMKLIGKGLLAYFTDGWCILDAFVVVVTWLGVFSDALGLSNIAALRALRTLRALRPLRAISKWQSMRLVINSLFNAMPAIFNVFVITALIWLIFAIMGVQLFRGHFYRCEYSNSTRVASTLIPDKTQCIINNFTWTKPLVNFDNVGVAFLALLQVGTFNGYLDIMQNAIDAVAPTTTNTANIEQPINEYEPWYYLYFVAFCIFGVFFALNLFIGVIVDQFSTLRKKYEGDFINTMLTPTQKRYIVVLRRFTEKKPEAAASIPGQKWRRLFYVISMMTYFDISITVVIVLNMIAMCIDYYNNPGAVTQFSTTSNIFFTSIFVCEAIIKLIGLGKYYFYNPWNDFDFAVVLFSVAGIIIEMSVQSLPISPSLLRIFRVFRIGRVLRFVRSARGIRNLLYALVASLPALINIAILLFLLIYIYAIIGMQSFGLVPVSAGLDEVFNYRTFPNAFLTQFQLMTGSGWDQVLAAITVQPPDCDSSRAQLPDGYWLNVSSCPQIWLAILVMVTFVCFSRLILINMYIAVILENFTKAHEQEEVGVTEDDVTMFFSVWERYDPQATEFVPLEYLSDFCDELDRPFKLPKPNAIKLVSLNIPIYEGEKCHALDVAKAVVSNKLGAVEDTEEFQVVMEDVEEKFKEMYPKHYEKPPISSTQRRKKEDIAAKTLQHYWREFKKRRYVQQQEAVSRARRMSIMSMRPTPEVKTHREREMEKLLSQVQTVKPPSNVQCGSQTSLTESSIGLSRSSLEIRNLPLNTTISVANLYEASGRRLKENLRPLPADTIKPIYPRPKPRPSQGSVAGSGAGSATSRSRLQSVSSQVDAQSNASGSGPSSAHNTPRGAAPYS